MNTKRPVVVTIAAILLIILSLFVGGLGIANQSGLLRQGFGNRQFAPGQFQGRNFPQGGFPNSGLPNDQNNQGETTQNFTPNRQIGTGLFRFFRLIRPVTIGFDVVLILLGGIAAIGLFMSKRWGVILAIVLSVLLILLAIPGFLRIFSAMVLIENLVRILLAVAVIVLLLLPTARQSYVTARASEDNAERIVR